MLDLKAEADRLEAAAFQLRQALRPALDVLRTLEDAARRLRQGGKPGPAGDPIPQEATR